MAMKKTPKKRESAIGPSMCKLCGHRHWGINPHTWPKTKKKKK